MDKEKIANYKKQIKTLEKDINKLDTENNKVNDIYRKNWRQLYDQLNDLKNKMFEEQVGKLKNLVGKYYLLNAKDKSYHYSIAEIIKVEQVKYKMIICTHWNFRQDDSNLTLYVSQKTFNIEDLVQAKEISEKEAFVHFDNMILLNKKFYEGDKDE